MIVRIIFICLILVSSNAHSRGVYQQPNDFVFEAFNSQLTPKVIWLKGALRMQVEAILQHKYNAKRIRYWYKDNRSVWVLEEVGKKKTHYGGNNY